VTEPARLRVPNPGPRYLVPFDLRKMRATETDVLVIGSGLAALRAAYEAASAGRRVIVVTKRGRLESNSRYAQGGIAAAIDEADTLESHVADTLTVGCGLCDEPFVRTVITEGADCVRELIDWGARFDRVSGRLAFAREGGHSRARVLHRGDQTGKELAATLMRLCERQKGIAIEEDAFAVDLLTRGGACVGAVLAEGRKLRAIVAHATILATGGAGQVYRETTNPSVATGDGLAMAYRAGAELMDMEMMQFHPTTLYLAGASRTLVTEAVRGASGTLRDRTGRAFMKDYDPLGDLAPRDVVSRAMLQQMLVTNDTQVYLDVRHIPKSEIKRQFPNLFEVCAKFGLDVAKEMIPVRPAAHYMVGGVRIDIDGRTNIARLFAAGECASGGLHGANRLASNSLAEALVFGARAARAEEGSAPASGGAGVPPAPPGAVPLTEIRDAADRVLGVRRSGPELAALLDRLRSWRTSDGSEVATLVASLVAAAALRRRESRGGHFRMDFPLSNDELRVRQAVDRAGWWTIPADEVRAVERAG
jgi:L-aspartate oxidase